MCFFSFQCLSNVLLVILYAIQAFSEHSICIVPTTGRNMAGPFEYTFKIGFYLHVAIFINVTYVDMYCKFGSYLL